MNSLTPWLPPILIFAVIIVVGRSQMRSYSKHVDRVEAINDELIALTREMSAELREIKEILKGRK